MERNSYRCILHTTRLPMTYVNRKNGIHGHLAHSRHTHIDSIHSPHKTRKTILPKRKLNLSLSNTNQLNLHKCMKKIKKIPSWHIFTKFFGIFLTK